MVSGFFVSRAYQSESKNLNPGGTNVVPCDTERILVPQISVMHCLSTCSSIEHLDSCVLDIEFDT